MNHSNKFGIYLGFRHDAGTMSGPLNEEARYEESGPFRPVVVLDSYREVGRTLEMHADRYVDQFDSLQDFLSEVEDPEKYLENGYLVTDHRPNVSRGPDADEVADLIPASATSILHSDEESGSPESEFDHRIPKIEKGRDRSSYAEITDILD